MVFDLEMTVKKRKAGDLSSQKMDDLLAALRTARLRVTEPRIAILALLAEKHGPFTVEEIHQKLTKICDLATVYRSFISLEKARLIQRCEFGDGTSRYELAEEKDHHHHHIVCRKCKKIEPLDSCSFAEVNRLADDTGYSDISHFLEFFGVCRICK